MADQLRKDDVGSLIRVRVFIPHPQTGVLEPMDLTDATVTLLKLKPPSSSTKERPMTFETNGTDGRLIYVTVAGDLSEAGPWTGQVYLELPPPKTWHTTPFNFQVADNLYALP